MEYPYLTWFVQPTSFHNSLSLSSQDVDLNSLEETPSVMGLLLALFDSSHLGSVVTHGLADQLCASMQSADPISVLGGKLEELSKDYRGWP